MANEKNVNRENLKAFRQRFQGNLENGTIVPSKSLSTKSIEAVSSESGSVQDTPFVYQGTGTANGTSIVDTSPVGKHLEKQGNSVVVNQQVQNGNFANLNNWVNESGVTLSVSNNVLTANCTIASTGFYQSSGNLKNGHYYLLSFQAKSSANLNLIINNAGTGGNTVTIGSSWTNVFFVNQRPNDATSNRLVGIYSASANTIFDVKNVFSVDLTQWFGSNDNIPQDLLDNPSNFYRYYNGSLAYNTGTLENSDGQYLECGGRNVWDEEWELGGIEPNGSLYPDNDRIRSKNYIKVNPNTEYYFYRNGSNSMRICYYDKDYNFVSYDSNANTTHTTPSDCSFIKIVIFGTTTYNHDITISLYYTTGDGYDQYYAYEQPKVYDTGNEVLRSVGSVKDYKEPNGTIHRLVGVVDLGSLSWDKYDWGFISTTAPTNIKGVGDNSFGNLLCANYETSSANRCFAMTYGDKLIATRESGKICIRDTTYSSSTTDQFKTAMNGVYLFYELLTPTIEQGTPFSENIEINDYGTMGWLDSNNAYVDIPQGCKIFYPADYVLFIDSLGQREDIEWDASEIVSQTQRTSDKTTQATLDTQLQNAIGGTLRHCLAIQESGLDFDDTDFVDLGSLTWTYSGTDGYFYTDLADCARPSSSSVVAKIISTKYKTDTAVNIVTGVSNKAIGKSGTSDTIMVKDTTYTDATQFKNAMKGVLLAYEKA